MFRKKGVNDREKIEDLLSIDKVWVPFAMVPSNE